jgi:hypothetical protein
MSRSPAKAGSSSFEASSKRTASPAISAVAYENSLVWIRSTPGTGGSPTVPKKA